jgi:hypothetical protein
MDQLIGPIILILGAAIALWLIFSIVHIVPEYERLVVFFFGGLQGARGPGIVLLIPIVQQAVKVDLRERRLELPAQQAVTRDNATISLDLLVDHRVVDPAQSVVSVTDLAGAVPAVMADVLRDVVGALPLAEVLADREKITDFLRTEAAKATKHWGVQVTGNCGRASVARVPLWHPECFVERTWHASPRRWLSSPSSPLAVAVKDRTESLAASRIRPHPPWRDSTLSRGAVEAICPARRRRAPRSLSF